MAWRCTGSTNAQLVNNLFSAGLIADKRVRDALLRVDRALYAPTKPYVDAPQPIGHGATISAPHMHATALAELAPFLLPLSPPATGPRRALDIGSGSGYLTHAMAELALLPGPGNGGGGDADAEIEKRNPVVVVGVEHVAPLAQLGEENLARSARGRALLAAGNVRFRVGDGRRGWIDDDGVGGEGQRYDAIHVGAAAKELHGELVAQLNAPGRMFIPLEDPDGWGQHVWAIDKDGDGKVTRRKLFGVQYVPLTDATYYVASP